MSTVVIAPGLKAAAVRAAPPPQQVRGQRVAGRRLHASTAGVRHVP